MCVYSILKTEEWREHSTIIKTNSNSEYRDSQAQSGTENSDYKRNKTQTE